MTRSPSLKLYSRKAKRAQPEASLQKTIIQWIVVAGVPGTFAIAPANEGQRTPRYAAYLKSLGMRPGASDLIIFRDGRAYALEVKAAGQKPSPNQIAFAADCVAASIPYAVVDNIDAAIATLRTWGVIRADMAGKWGSISKRQVAA